jgi:hypothetical protein
MSGSLEKLIPHRGSPLLSRICHDHQSKNLSSKASMVLPPPCHGNNIAHLHSTGREASCPHIVSRGLRLGTLSKKKEHKMVPNPKFRCSHIRHSVSCLFMQSSMVVLQSKIHAFKHCTAQCMCAREA